MRLPIIMSLAGLLLVAANSHAWWGGVPYGAPYNGWNNAWPWPAYVAPYGYQPYANNRGYGSSDWNVSGTMNEWGDTHFVIEYHGNIYDDMYGVTGNRPYAFPGYGYPYYGGWR